MIELELQWSAIWPLKNILNEICYGLDIDIYSSTGYRFEEIFKLMKKLSSYKHENNFTNSSFKFNINEDDLNILNACIEKVAIEIEEWEFQTRIGVTLDEIRNNPIFTSNHT